MHSDPVSNIVAHIIAKQAMIPVEAVTMSATPAELGLDSLGLVETIFAIEEQFDILVPFNANEGGTKDFDISTVGSVVAAVRNIGPGPGMRRVAITGAGTVNPLAQDVAGTYAALAEGRSAIGPLEFRDVERLTVRIGAQIKGWHPEAQFTRADLTLMDPFCQYAVASARQAVTQSGLSFDGELAETSGVIIGSAGGGLQTTDDNYRAVYEAGKARVHPFVVPRLMLNAAAAQVAIAHGLQGPVFAVSSACSSSNHAIGQAFQLIRSGSAKVMLAGGADAMLCFGGMKAWEGVARAVPNRVQAVLG